MIKNIVILGAGESGTGAALLAKAKGYNVFVSDKSAIQDKYKAELANAGIEFEETQHTEERILAAELAIKSPGIPDSAPIVKLLAEKDIEIISEIEFASRFTKAKFIAITGSNGKTTTTLLTYHLLKKLGLNVGLAGNIGDSLAKQVIEDSYEYYVLELSSFQLDGMFKFKAHVSILLNITPDHLDRYNYEFQNYIDSKFRIIQNQTQDDYFITFSDDEVIRKELSKRIIAPRCLKVSVKERTLDGAYFADDKIVINKSSGRGVFYNLDSKDLPLKGKHNMVNIMAASLAAVCLGFEPDKIQPAISDFKNASHRLEEVAEINGVRFVNDSKATNVDSVFYALDSFNEPIVWIAGGVDKGNDYASIAGLVKDKVKALVCMGKDNSKLIKAFDTIVPALCDTSDIKDAVFKAYEIAKPGDVVLLSPACASFDLFKNYEDRGAQFKQQVNNLIERK